tara:strand:+ start:343 stop:714 length:372 start_codon:yes stop_codon:yes gene_type:complete
MLNRVIKILKRNNFGRFFEVGSYARKELNPKDYDIIILPSLENKEDWTRALRILSKCKYDGKKVDAQIVPQFNLVLEDRWQHFLFDKYTFYDGSLRHKSATMINDKNKKRGWNFSMPFIYREI